MLDISAYPTIVSGSNFIASFEHNFPLSILPKHVYAINKVNQLNEHCFHGMCLLCQYILTMCIIMFLLYECSMISLYVCIIVACLLYTHRAFKHAERLQVKQIILFTSEWERGSVRVKNLTSREEKDILVDNLIAELSSWTA